VADQVLDSQATGGVRIDIEHRLGGELLDDPYPIYAELRLHHPVYWSESWKAWLVSRYADVFTGCRLTTDFSSYGRVRGILNQVPEDQRAEFEDYAEQYMHGLLDSDPPDHTRLRALIGSAFTPRVVDELRPFVEQTVGRMLEEATSSAKRRMDVIAQLAEPLPMVVITRMLGLPSGDGPMLKDLTAKMLVIRSKALLDVAALRRAREAATTMREYLGEVVVARRRHPSTDLISRLATASVGDDRLSDADIFQTCSTLILGGHETTTNLLGNGLLALLRHPRELRRLRDQPALMPTAVEELLRYDAPVQRLVRVVHHAVRLGDVIIGSGEVVVFLLGAANRDPEAFSEPDRLDIGRHPNRHLAFGWGAHFCLGAPLARLEAAVALRSILDLLPNLQPAGDRLDWHPHGAIRGLVSLPVTW
jgi:cytochrome P450